MSAYTKRSHIPYIDIPLLIGILMIMSVSVVILYSAADINKVYNQIYRFGAGIIVMILVLFIPKTFIKFFTPAFYIFTFILLLAVYFIGIEINGSQRWLNVGVQIQPSEFAKISIPLMLSYYLGRRPLPPKLKDIFISFVIILIPTSLVYMQPDLGTSILVASSGISLLFLSGISWRLIIAFVFLGVISIPYMWIYALKDYQRERIITLFNPELDPFGKGYNIIQSKIAIGSGGIYGKGWMQGTQSQLEFLPERTTDFIFAVFSEEFGLIGIISLFVLYIFILFRGFWLAVNMPDNFSKLLSGALLTTFFVYFFINVGMVSGILPVVGLPLPFVSYGGTSIMTLMVGFGLIMNLYGTREEKKTRGLL